MRELNMKWVVGSELSILRLVYPHLGNDPDYYHVTLNNFAQGQLVKYSTGWTFIA